MKKIILSLSLAAIASFSSCSVLTDMLNPQSSQNSQITSEQESTSQTDEIVKPDLMWDTET